MSSLQAHFQNLRRAVLAEIQQDSADRLVSRDVAIFKRLKASTRIAELCGRLTLHFGQGPISWAIGTLSLAYYFSAESQMNHTVMHGAYVGHKGSHGLTPDRYETMAVPFQSKTWGGAHRIHHANPSLLGLDPDTIHPLIRIHENTPWKPWHRFNTFLGAIFVFETWAFNYDRFLKSVGARPQNDRGEIKKFSVFTIYNYVFFPLLAGDKWAWVFGGNLCANIIRNWIFVALQTGSSVGHNVSTRHPTLKGGPRGDDWFRFQIETSKNFVISRFLKVIFGGLDRHIEHHLFPNLPPNRLHSLSSKVKEICQGHAIIYEEHSSLWASLKDSFSYLHKLSRR